MTKLHSADEAKFEQEQHKLIEMGEKAKRASLKLGSMEPGTRIICLHAIAHALEAATDDILKANEIDMTEGEANGLSEAKLERLKLTPARIKAMADGLRQVAAQDEVVGRVLSSVTSPNGLVIDKVSVPIGVIGIIYESRPNVTVDAAGICLKAGNAVILRGGKEAIHSNRKLAEIMTRVGETAGLPEGAIQLIPWICREAVDKMLTMDQYIDLIIPRGGEALIRKVVRDSTIPVIKHYKGVCHIFVDAQCDQDMALDIIENAKCSRPAVCNAVETILIHKNIAREFAPKLYARMNAAGVEMQGDKEFNRITGNKISAVEEDYYTEHMALVMAVKIVNDVHAAVEHINHYGSHHSEAIISSVAENVKYFFAMTDSSTLYHNASTRFTDGGEFGMGAEIGISTDKLHARGPMGVAELTSTKYIVHGTGQVRK